MKNQTSSFLGELPENPDHIPCAPPCGFIWVLPGALGGSYESFGITDVRVSLNGRKLDFVMTYTDIEFLKELLEEALVAMRQAGADDDKTRVRLEGTGDAG
ncbi:MAG: hypothetical protein GYB53_24240 [Rhodobacteraceae bacterium]|nr:hypothetical protein [Paracoccaceae bacterium]MBR9821940.1 hypothetical protein [Paracoccaceae bacterium]